MNKIHKIGELSSKKKYFPESKLENNRISENVLVTTETLAGIKSPWKNIQGTITADNGYKWVRKYEVGKNYIIEKILNKSNELVALYIDICSPIEKKR